MKTIAIIDYTGAKAGMDYYSYSLAKGLANNNLKVLILSNFENNSDDRISVKIVYNRKAKKIFSKMFDAFFGTVKAGIICKKNKANFLINHLFSAETFSFMQYLILYLMRIKIVTIVHDVVGFGKGDNEFFRKMIVRKFSWKLVVHNNFSYLHAIKKGVFYKEQKVHIIPHGGFIDKLKIQEKVDREKAFNHFNLDLENNYILFFGQIKEEKGLDILLEAFKESDPHVKLIIAGRPPRGLNFDKYQEQIDKHPNKDSIICYIRFIEDEEMHYLFSICKAIILPYRIIYQSGVLLMAMSLGIPVIASDLEPNQDIINKTNGILFKSNDSHDLSMKLNTYLRNCDVNYKTLRENAFKTIRNNYAWDKIAENYIEFIFKQ